MEKFKEALCNVNFSERYKKICNNFCEYDLHRNFKKSDLEKTLNTNEFKFSASEKCFFVDYKIKDYNFRFVLSYKSGFIECFYSLWTENNSNRINGRFNSIASMIDESFKEKVNYSFPIATSLEDLISIITELLKLHNDFKAEFLRKVEQEA